MRPNKNKIYNHLFSCQQRFGGYTGRDLDETARKLGFDRRTIKRNVEKWSKTDPSFVELEYIGKHSIIITLEDIAIINQRLKEKITSKKQDIIREINDTRVKQGNAPIPQSTLHRIINNLMAALTHGAPQELHWLAIQGIEVSDTYNLANARASLSDIFTYSDLKTFGGIDIDSISSRLQEAQKWFQQTYPGADPFEWFPRIRLRSKVIRNHLSRIKANASLADQALLIFEAQVDFIVRLKDILIDELIHRMGWIQRSKNGNRQKIENRTRTRWIDKYYDVGDKVSANPNKGNLAKLKEYIDRGKPESDEAEQELMKQHQVDYEKIYEHLKKLTNNFSEAEITHHHTTAQVLLDLCIDERKWEFLTEKERENLTKNRLIKDLREPG
jgi:hypothetical protein